MKNKLIVMLSCLYILGCGATNIPPGQVGIVVNMHGTARGVQDYTVRTGRVYYSLWSENVYVFPISLQNIVWTKSLTEGNAVDESITFNSVEGAVINADIALGYYCKEEKVPYLFVKFAQPIEQITNVFIRSKVRDAFSSLASKMIVTDIFGARKQELLDNVKEVLNGELESQGFHFDMVSFVGALRVDENVAKSINATIEAKQRAIEAENKVAQATAEARQKIETARGDSLSLLIAATAQSEANNVLAASFAKNPKLLTWEAIKKWNGVMPQVMSNNAMPFIDFDNKLQPQVAEKK